MPPAGCRPQPQARRPIRRASEKARSFGPGRQKKTLDRRRRDRQGEGPQRQVLQLHRPMNQAEYDHQLSGVAGTTQWV